jgi:small nuclear ribonucleoprotein (snRNP)-like protein
MCRNNNHQYPSLIKEDYKSLGFQLFVLVIILIKANCCIAQHDSLILKNGNTIVGEIKTLDNGVITIKTGYSKSDFAIKWPGVKEFYSRRYFLVTLKDGRRINGLIQSVDAARNVTIKDEYGRIIETLLDNVIFLKRLKSVFWSRVKASIDIGLSITRANNLRQLTVNSSLGFLADKWDADGYYNIIRAARDSVNATKRTDAGLSFKDYLPKNWFLSTSLNFLSNTEQALKLRTLGKLGGGKFFIHNNKTYWGAGAGLSFNNESYTNNNETKNSLEGFLGSELNMFDTGDLNLFSSLYVYPSFTESGRWRSDFRVDCKYDLPHDIYIKLGLTFNYDNRPAVAGKETDFLLGFTVGWKL